MSHYHYCACLLVTILAVNSLSAADRRSELRLNEPASGELLNIGFGDDPGPGRRDGVMGTSHDFWNLIAMGTTAKEVTRFSDATISPVRMRITKHDGAWGISGNPGIFHGYIYDNCQCIDLQVELLDVRAGKYRALVYAHGDAPNQNARIELLVGEESLGSKATANDGSWRFRSKPFKEGVHYVSFDFDVPAGEPVKLISHRDGSGYSMFNAIQIVRLDRD